jgi:Flp pilus assembly protein TadG
MVDMPGLLPRSLLRSATRPAADESGVAAIEFAFLAPVALAFLSLAFAGGQGLSVYHKTVMTAHIVTDMVSRTPYNQDTNVANAEKLAAADLDSDLGLGQLVMYPNDATNLKVVMTELLLDNVGKTAKVVWSEGYNGGVALACNATVTLDASYYASGATYVVYGQASYTYQPLGVSFNLSPITFNSTEVLTVRNATQITVPGVQNQC